MTTKSNNYSSKSVVRHLKVKIEILNLFAVKITRFAS